MKKIAVFQFDINCHSEEDFEKLKGVVDQWLKSKGEIGESDNEWHKFNFNYGEGLEGHFKEDHFSSSIGTLKSYKLLEHKGTFDLQTTIEITLPKEGKISCNILNEIENKVSGAPNRFIIRRPKLIKDILDAFHEKIDDVPYKPLDFKGDEGLSDYLGYFLSETRKYPLVVISTDSNNTELSELLLEKLAYDLTATAFVCRIDEDISKKISERGGATWSCYNGAIRVFWSSVKKNDNPFHHPLWTSDKILRRGDDNESISGSVSSMLRKQLIMDLSPYSVVSNTTSLQIRESSRDEAFEERIRLIRGQSLDAEVYEAMIDEYELQLKSYKATVLDKDNEIAILKYQLEELGRLSVSDSSDTKAPEVISSVQQAVEIAGKNFSSSIEFFKNIDKSIKTISEVAGPPEKILEYFEKLDVLTDEILASGEKGIGKTHLKWLQDNGVKCSGESDTTKKNAKAQQKRTFSFDGEDVLFDKHMKLGDATDIKHCVRIYFEWSDRKQKFLVGYVGEHLD